MFNKFFFLQNLTAEQIHCIGEFIGRFSTPVNNTYSVWMMEKDNGNEVVILIHEDDNEIAGILDARTGKILYLHPNSIDGAMKLWNI